MTSVEHGIVTEPGEVRAILDALATEPSRLLLGASRPGRAVGAVVAVHADRFVLASTLLAPEPVAPALSVARGEVGNLAVEACTIVDDIADFLGVPATPLTPGRGTPLAAEDALTLADQLRRGDPVHLDEALALIGLADAPVWLRDLAPGAPARLTATLVEPAGFEMFADITATPHGWGELLCSDDDVLTFDPLSVDDVRQRIESSCETLVMRAGASRRVA